LKKQLVSSPRQQGSLPAPADPVPQQQQVPDMNSGTSIGNTPVMASAPKYKLSDFKPSIFQSLNSMLEINPNILLFRHHPHLKTYIHTPIEQAINESFQTVQRSLKVATSAAETIVRKDFLFNPDEQQLRTSARNMVAYLSSGLVLITARSPLQEQIQSYIKAHFHTVLGLPPASTMNQSDQTTSDMIQQASLDIATGNIELCCCLLQRITISRAIQLIDQRLTNDIEQRQRCRTEGRRLLTENVNHDERLPEPIRLHYGPLSSHLYISFPASSRTEAKRPIQYR
jgi:CCR4-NOT transcription complex subunit 1